MLPPSRPGRDNGEGMLCFHGGMTWFLMHNASTSGIGGCDHYIFCLHWHPPPSNPVHEGVTMGDVGLAIINSLNRDILHSFCFHCFLSRFLLDGEGTDEEEKNIRFSLSAPK